MNEPSPQDPLAHARQLLQEGRTADAVSVLDATLTADPENPDALALLGMAQGRLGNMEAATTALEHARAVRPGDTSIAYNLAVALSRSGRRDQAIAELQRVLQADPAHERAKAALASLSAEHATEAAHAGAPEAAPGPLQEGEHPPAPQPVHGVVGGMPAPTALSDVLEAPSKGCRILRGLGWGLLCGQIWTAWFMFWEVVYQGASLGGLGIGILAFLCVVFFAIAGAFTGLVVGVSGADRRRSGLIGGVCGLGLCALEMALSGSASMVINVLFWWFTGQAVGAAIGARVNASVSGRAGR